MTHLQLETDRIRAPLDVVERWPSCATGFSIAAETDEMFDRGDGPVDRVSRGLHLDRRHGRRCMWPARSTCACRSAGRSEMLQLVSRVIEQLWGRSLRPLERGSKRAHVPQSLLLAGGAEPSHAQCETMLRASVVGLRALLPGLPVRDLGRQERAGSPRERALRDRRRSLIARQPRCGME
jgi:hypothetical protein